MPYSNACSTDKLQRTFYTAMPILNRKKTGFLYVAAYSLIFQQVG